MNTKCASAPSQTSTSWMLSICLIRQAKAGWLLLKSLMPLESKDLTLTRMKSTSLSGGLTGMVTVAFSTPSSAMPSHHTTKTWLAKSRGDRPITPRTATAARTSSCLRPGSCSWRLLGCTSQLRSKLRCFASASATGLSLACMRPSKLAIAMATATWPETSWLELSLPTGTSWVIRTCKCSCKGSTRTRMAGSPTRSSQRRWSPSAPTND